MGAHPGTFWIDPDKAIDPTNIRPDDILCVLIPTPNIQQESTRRFKGIHARVNGPDKITEEGRKQQGPVYLRCSIVELQMLEAAAAQIGVKRHQFVRQAALSVAEAVLNGDRDPDNPNIRVSVEGYRRRRASHVG